MKLTTLTYSTMLGLATTLSLLALPACKAGNSISAQSQQSFFENAAGSPIRIPDGAGNVVIGDMNNDKNLDVVVACGRSPGIKILLGKGDGQFVASTNAITLSESPSEIALGDINNDGNLDLALATHDSYGVQLLLGDGKGGLTKAPQSPIVIRPGQHPHTHGLLLADLNHDNKLDLVTVNSTDNDVSVALGDGHGNFTRIPGSPFPVGPSPYPGAVGDVNGDGQLDIVATATATGPLRAQQLPFARALTLLVADGHGGFQSSQLPLRTGEPWFAVIRDISGDGKPDIVVTHHERNELSVLIGDGSGGFVETKGSPFDFGHHAFHADVAEVNHDGKEDVIAAGGNGLLVMLGDGHGSFVQGGSIQTGQGAWRLALGDLNRDGKIDVVASNLESGTVSVLLGK